MTGDAEHEPRHRRDEPNERVHAPRLGGVRLQGLGGGGNVSACRLRIQGEPGVTRRFEPQCMQECIHRWTVCEYKMCPCAPPRGCTPADRQTRLR